MAQGMVLVLLGAAALGCTLASDLYLNYVQGAFRPFLAAAGAVLALLGAARVAAELRRTLRPPAEDGTAEAVAQGGDGGEAHGDPHDHAHGAPRVAWLLLLPAIFVFVVSPPPLGAFTAETGQRAEPPAEAAAGPAAAALEPLPEADGPVAIELKDFLMRAWLADPGLEGREVQLTGFVTESDEGGWYLTRLEMNCCAADAIVNQVVVSGAEAPPTDSWVSVVGTWVPPQGDTSEQVPTPELAALTVIGLDAPPDPYE
ncbi:TIGR03943 family putative permease subunit [Allonocardiopsis opalescens]|nr:TIGR03943 family protein [Allonocardiopsis opalescens]